jgi:hypothetical protein
MYWGHHSVQIQWVLDQVLLVGVVLVVLVAVVLVVLVVVVPVVLVVVVPVVLVAVVRVVPNVVVQTTVKLNSELYHVTAEKNQVP